MEKTWVQTHKKKKKEDNKEEENNDLKDKEEKKDGGEQEQKTHSENLSPLDQITKENREKKNLDPNKKEKTLG